MNVQSSINQYPTSPPSIPGDTAGPELNRHGVEFIKSDKHLIRQFLHRANNHIPRHSRPKTLRLSGREIEFANSTNFIQRLLYRIRCHISPPAPLNRQLTSDNKENPCDLAARSVPELNAAKLSTLGASRMNAIRMSAKRYGGEVVFKFSQSKGEFNKQIALHSATQRGAVEHYVITGWPAMQTV